MNEDSYYELLLQKYRLAVALAVLRNKPDNISVESYIKNMRNKICESDLCNSLTNLGVDEDDFNMSDSDLNFNSLSLNMIEENSNDSVTILKDFDYNALDTGNQNNLNEVEQINENSMVTETVTKIVTQTDTISIIHQMDKDPIDNDLIYSENDIQLRLRVENNLQRDMVDESNDLQSQSLITNIENDFNLLDGTESYTHISQSQDNINIQQNLFRNKRKLETNNNRTIFNNAKEVVGPIVKSTAENIDCNALNDLVSQSVQMHIPKKLKPIQYTEDTIDSASNGNILENIPALESTNNDNISQDTLFSPHTQNCSLKSIFQMDCDTHENSSQNDLQNHLSMDFSFDDTLLSQKQNLSKENVSNYSKTQSLGSDNLDFLNDTNSLNCLTLNKDNIKTNSHIQKNNDKIANSYDSVASLNENVRTMFSNNSQNINKQINERDDSTEGILIKDSTNLNESTIYSSQDSFGFLSVKQNAIKDLSSNNEIEFSNQVILKINGIHENNGDKNETNESHVTNDLLNEINESHDFANESHDFANERHDFSNERHDFANETNEFSNETNDFAVSSDDEMINDLSKSQSEIIPFKVMEELNKIKTFLNRSDLNCTDSRSDSGYKSNFRVSFNSASQSGLWLNQSSHSLFSYISQTPLLVSLMDINYEIAKVLGELIDRLHEDEKYPSFLEDMLEFIANLLLSVYEGTSSDENVFLKNNESIDRLILLNKSRNIIKFTIEKIIKILESFYENIQKDEIIELNDINNAENLSYIFHLLEILLKKYNTTKLSQNSQSQDEKVLKRSTLTEIWRKKWNLSRPEDFQKEEKQDILVHCSDILNKIVVKTMDGYSLVAYAALQCFNLLQS